MDLDLLVQLLVVVLVIAFCAYGVGLVFFMFKKASQMNSDSLDKLANEDSDDEAGHLKMIYRMKILKQLVWVLSILLLVTAVINIISKE